MLQNKGQYYDEGFRNGKLDKSLGHDSVIARTCPNYNLPGYAEGYKDGQNYKEEVKVKTGRLVESYSSGFGRITSVFVMGGFTVQFKTHEGIYSSLNDAMGRGLQFYNDAEDNYI
jgi:hypothetical protein